MFDYLPDKLLRHIYNFDCDKITEIRLRCGKPAYLEFDGNVVRICNEIVNFSEIEEIVLKLTKRSIYAYSDCIKRGYIYGDNGERIGLCGKFVYVDDKLKSITEIRSLCIRIPHEIQGVADAVKDRCFYNGVKSIVVISPPGGGKTTFLRDLSRIVSDYYKLNVLVVDEKNEFYGLGKFNLGERTDVMTGVKKSYGIESGVLNMRPDVIVTDELSEPKDIFYAKKAVLSGVKLMASAHATSVEELSRKPYFNVILDEKLFDYAIVLSIVDMKRQIQEFVKL